MLELTLCSEVLKKQETRPHSLESFADVQGCTDFALDKLDTTLSKTIFIIHREENTGFKKIRKTVIHIAAKNGTSHFMHLSLGDVKCVEKGRPAHQIGCCVVSSGQIGLG